MRLLFSRLQHPHKYVPSRLRTINSGCCHIGFDPRSFGFFFCRFRVPAARRLDMGEIISRRRSRNSLSVTDVANPKVVAASFVERPEAVPENSRHPGIRSSYKDPLSANFTREANGRGLVHSRVCDSGITSSDGDWAPRFRSHRTRTCGYSDESRSAVRFDEN